MNEENVAISASRIYSTYGFKGTKWFCFKQSIVQNIPVSLIMHRTLNVAPKINEIILRCLEDVFCSIGKWKIGKY